MSVLIYRLGSLGDTIVALPALKLVERAFYREERWLLTNVSAHGKAAPMATILEGTKLIDGVLEYPIGARSPRVILELRKRIREKQAHTLVDLSAPRGLPQAWRDFVFFRSCGIRQIIGSPLMPSDQHPLRLPNGVHESHAAMLVRRIAELGVIRIDDPEAFDLRFSDKEKFQANKIIEPLAGRELIAVSLGAKVDVKDWEDIRWRPLLVELARRYPDHGLVALGSPDEAQRCERVCQPWAGRFVNTCGQLSVRVSGAVLAHCKVFVGHDSGPMHLAAACGVRCVAIFSSRNLPGEWFPFGSGHRVLFRDIPCQGCRRDVCSDLKKACIRSITVEEVLQAVATCMT